MEQEKVSRLRQHFLTQQFYKGAGWKGTAAGVFLGMHYWSITSVKAKILSPAKNITF